MTITFSEAVTGFTNADFTVANGTLTRFSSGDGGVTWTATLTPTRQRHRPHQPHHAGQCRRDRLAGNAGSGTTDSNNYAIDTDAPTATIVVTDTALRSAKPRW